MKRWTSLLAAPAIVVLLAACSSHSAGPASLPAVPPQSVADAMSPDIPAAKVKHIVVVIEENRSVDNLFNGFCVASGCANTVQVDPVSGQALVPESLAAPYSPFHEHSQFVVEYDGGKMDGFVNAKSVCEHNQKPCPYSVLAYVPSSETGIYRQLATVDGLLSDATFETNQGPSFPAHFYAIAGQSGGKDSDHLGIISGSGNCNTNKPVSNQIYMNTAYPGKAGPKSNPCKDFPTIFDKLSAKGHTWRYYSDGNGFWSPTQAIQHLNGSANYESPSNKFIADVANNNLADVSFVSPNSPSVSDHPIMVKNASAGPNWVASVVNAVGESPYWNTTAIVIWWDDWGGFYDHVAPPKGPVYPYTVGTNPFEYGFRVPLILVSPYARVGTIDHTKRTFVSAIKLIEETFKLGSMGTADSFEPDGLDGMFNFSQKALPYTPVGGSQAQPFRHLAPPQPEAVPDFLQEEE